MKKVICMLIIVSIISSSSYSFSLGDDNKTVADPAEEKTEVLALEYVGENIFCVAENLNTTDARSIEGNVVIAEKSDDNPDVYYIESTNEFVMFVGEERYQLADKIDLSVTDISEIETLPVPQEVKETIEEDLENSPDGIVKGCLFIPSNSQARDQESTMDYKYGAYNMRQYLYTFENAEARNVEVSTGVTTREKVDAAIDWAFTVLGETVENINAFTFAASLFKDYLTITGSSASFVSASGDSVAITPHWNRYLKFTYCDLFHDGNYFLGLKSICAQLTKIEYDMYFVNANGGKDVDITKNIYRYVYSPNYKAPDAVAVSCASTEPRLEDLIVWNIYSKKNNEYTLLCVVDIM